MTGAEDALVALLAVSVLGLILTIVVGKDSSTLPEEDCDNRGSSMGRVDGVPHSCGIVSEHCGQIR